MKVLIVDDEPLVRQVLGYALSREGWEVFAHDQYVGCVSVIREQGVDVVVTDYSLAGITGLDLIEDLRNASIEIPVLILSANVYAIDRERAKRLDVFDIFAKPPNMNQLCGALTQAVMSGKQTA